MARILIIDDDELLGRMLVRGLTAAGHTVAVALNGFDGANLFRKDPADLILTDINMPHGGLPTIRVLHAEFPKLNIIAMSGNSSQLDMAGAIGASRILEKPFTIEELKAVIDATLGTPVEPPPAKS
jgi:DNA-binding response OmpR family regulator